MTNIENNNLTDEEVRQLYEAISEKRTADALDIIYEACGDYLGLLYPTTQLHVAELRVTS